MTATISKKSFQMQWALWCCAVVALTSVSDGFSTRSVVALRKRIPFVTVAPTDETLLATRKAHGTSFTTSLMSSFSADGSEYSSKESDYDIEEVDLSRFQNMDPSGIMEDEVETEELQPVPLSKNAGNRFVALYWDHELQRGDPNDKRDPWELHYDRDELNEDHVMFCRKRNLYNETFNTDSMVDIMRSFPM
jgi:hypothetical protein